ncbi:Bro-N domain-containing protein [Acidithiobacillus sp. IBUN Pt1247-S3]|uniref:BRO-N domain-containing protein n=1 Tax=Acidithiobacillus sp. IBUN Pt1247-S3 TaxID=3166642 RepID=UPI0034E474CE
MNTSNIIPFAFNKKAVRVITDEHGEPWWVATDVCKVLGLEQVSRALSRLDADEKMTMRILRSHVEQGLSNNAPGTAINLVNEPGLLRLIMTSTKKEAKTFQYWVFHVVLPSIRRTGNYNLSGSSEPKPKTSTSGACHPSAVDFPITAQLIQNFNATIDLQQSIYDCTRPLAIRYAIKAFKAQTQFDMSLWLGGEPDPRPIPSTLFDVSLGCIPTAPQNTAASDYTDTPAAPKAETTPDVSEPQQQPQTSKGLPRISASVKQYLNTAMQTRARKPYGSKNLAVARSAARIAATLVIANYYLHVRDHHVPDSGRSKEITADHFAVSYGTVKRAVAFHRALTRIRSINPDASQTILDGFVLDASTRLSVFTKPLDDTALSWLATNIASHQVHLLRPL